MIKRNQSVSFTVTYLKLVQMTAQSYLAMSDFISSNLLVRRRQYCSMYIFDAVILLKYLMIFDFRTFAHNLTKCDIWMKGIASISYSLRVKMRTKSCQRRLPCPGKVLPMISRKGSLKLHTAATLAARSREPNSAPKSSNFPAAGWTGNRARCQPNGVKVSFSSRAPHLNSLSHVNKEI